MNGDYAIVADPKGPGWRFANSVFQDLKKRSEKYKLHEVEVTRFRDGEIKPRIQQNIRGKTCFFLHDSSKKPSDWLTELLLINQAIHKSSPESIIDVIPYLLFSRQDRKDQSRVPISAAAVANTIDLYADGVVTVDVHNPAIDGFYNKRFDNLHSFPRVVEYLKNNKDISRENTIVMSPDAGGAARAESFAKRLGIEGVVIGYKTRKEAGEVNQLKISGDVRGKDVFIIDDIVDSGGTLVKASQVARDKGASKVYAYCTHGLFTKGTDHVTDKFDKFFIGDTIYQKPNERLEVISLAPLFAETIYRMSHGESLSALFE
jgi:ribose-phosphate pyrophosphokinase